MSRPRLLLLALFAALPLLAEQPISLPVARAATGAQRSPALAAWPTDALAVWEDARADDPILHPGADIYATRLGLDGAPSGDGGVPITPDVRSEYSPAVVWSGSDYLVAHLVQGTFGDRGGIRLTRVTLDGPVEEHLLAAADYDPSFAITSSHLEMATNGDVTLLVLGPLFPTGLGLGAKPGVFGVLVDRNLRLLRPAFPLTADADPHAVSVASNGRDFLVAWRQYDSAGSLVRTAAVSADGAVSAASTVASLLAVATNPPAIVWNGSRYLVAAADGNVHARFVNADGTPTGAPIDVAPGLQVAAAWNGGEFLVAVAVPGDGSDIYAVRLDAVGRVLDAAPHAITASPGDQTQPAVTALGGRFLVAWTDVDTVRSSIVTPAADPLPQSQLALSLGAQAAPRTLFDGNNLGFVWEEEGHVFFGRSTTGGRPLDGGGIDLGIGGAPRLAFNGSEYLVTWTYLPPLASPATHAVRIAPGGTLLDATPLELPFTTAKIATNGTDFLVAQVEPGSTFRFRPVVVTASGEVHVEADPIGNPSGESVLSVDWTGTNYLVVYQNFVATPCQQRVCTADYETRSLLLDAGGHAAAQPKFIAPMDRTVSLNYLAAFGDGVEAVVIPNDPLRVELLDRNGVVTGERRVPCPGSCFVTRVLWTGSDFAVLTLAGVQRISRDGIAIAPPYLFEQDVTPNDLTSVDGALAFPYIRRVAIEPPAPNGFVRRGFWSWVPRPRRRAAG